jgi:glycosyltransferase involved in cell wall biosynthesis
MLTSWDERCGIAEYSRHLVEALRRRVEVEVTPATFRRSPRAVYAAMGRAVSGADVVHVQHSYAFFGGMHPLRSGWSAFAGALTRPAVITVHELDLRTTGAGPLPSTLESAYKRHFNRSVFLHPALRQWLVHSTEIREQLVGLGVPAGRVLYRPMPIAPAPEAPDPAPFLAEQRLAGTRPLVILGFLARRKGYDVALAALRELPEEYVLVAAGGEHAADHSGTGDWLRREAERLGVSRRLRITGYLDAETLEQAAAAAHLVLAPFREMSGSASLAYALARGAGVVASDLEENRKLSGVRLFPAGDAAALAREVRALSTAPAELQRLRQSAREYAARHGFEALAAELAEVYADIHREKASVSR